MLWNEDFLWNYLCLPFQVLNTRVPTERNERWFNIIRSSRRCDLLPGNQAEDVWTSRDVNTSNALITHCSRLHWGWLFPQSGLRCSTAFNDGKKLIQLFNKHFLTHLFNFPNFLQWGPSSSGWGVWENEYSEWIWRQMKCFSFYSSLLLFPEEGKYFVSNWTAAPWWIKM